MKNSKKTTREFITCPICKGKSYMYTKLYSKDDATDLHLVSKCVYCDNGLAVLEITKHNLNFLP